MDDLDGRLIDLFAADPRVGVLEASRRLGVARGTVQARLDKLVGNGVITGWGPDLSPEALGYPVTAFLTLEIRQEAGGRGHDTVGTHLASIPEVLEAHTITGAGDLMVRVVARSNTDLQRVIDLVLGPPGDRPLLDGDRPGHAGAIPGAPTGCGGPLTVCSTQLAAGSMLWFRWKTLPGSNSCLTATNRSQDSTPNPARTRSWPSLPMKFR